MKKFFSRFYVALILLFMYAPILVLITFSFNESKGRSWTGFSFKWYGELLRDDAIIGALGNTLMIAVIAAVVSTILGTVAAIGIHNMRRPYKTIVKNVNNLPLINPEIVMGISLMILFSFCRIHPGFVTIIIAHITFCIPSVILSVMPKLTQINNSIYEAALDLGCNDFQAFYKVILPEIMPGIISGFLMAFTYSIDDFVISYFTAGPDSQTLPLVIYTITRKPMTPKLNALSTIIFVIVLFALVISNVLSGKDVEKQKKIKKNV
ncbi:MAG: ABC transporter permease [Clostridia bacterium]|nr:ABC transporter permease [Clostridia bacterium]